MSYTCQMEKKKNSDVKRKNSIPFKKRRNHLHNRRRQGTTRKEKQEGKTYESNIGMNLDQSVSVPATNTAINESNTELNALIKEKIPRETLTVYEEEISSFTPRPNCPSKEFDKNVEYNIILFDVETNATGKAAQLCQLSAIDKTCENCFSTYILPDNDINNYATRVNKLTIQSVNGKRTLFKNNEALETLTCQEATSRFVKYVNSCIRSSKARTSKDVCTILIGHNARRFDIPILLRNSASEIHVEMQALGICFGDSLPLFEHLSKTKHPALTKSNGKRCPSNQSSIYESLFNEKFDAHDAKEDVIALQRILFSSPINLTEQDIVTHCKPISTVDALKDTQYLDNRHRLLQTMKHKLYSEVTSNETPITKSMAEKIAGSGLSYEDLQHLYTNHGKKGLIAVLSKPPTTSENNKPRVTKTPKILSSI